MASREPSAARVSDQAYAAAINCIRSLWPLRDSGVHQVFLRHAIRVARAWRHANV